MFVWVIDLFLIRFVAFLVAARCARSSLSTCSRLACRMHIVVVINESGHRVVRCCGECLQDYLPSTFRVFIELGLECARTELNL